MQAREIDLISAAFKRDPFPTFGELRAAGPLVRVRLPWVGRCWVTTTYEAASAVLRDRVTFVNDPANAGRKTQVPLRQKLLGPLKTNAMTGRDGPDHRRLRALAELAFRRRSVEAMGPQITDLVDRQLDLLEASATGPDGLVDVVDGFARHLPLAVIWGLLGLPEEERPDKLWADFGSLSGPVSMIKLYPGLVKLKRYLRRQFEICRKEPRPGLISNLVEAELEGDRLSRKELLATTFQLLTAGYETTVHLLSGGVLMLLRHPEAAAELMADWSKAGPAVDEVLRYLSPVEMSARYVSRDGELLGQHLERGDYVVVLLAAANVDPAFFPDPETFDIHRRPNRHLAFGGGVHTCLGMSLARLEGEIALERLFTRYPCLKLAVPYDELEWAQAFGLHHVVRLPVHLHPR